jgi:hypothetical protein
LTNRFTTSSNVRLSRELTRRVSVGLNYDYNRSGTLADSLGLIDQRGGAFLSYGLGRGVGVRIAYFYQDSGFGTGSANRYRSHSMDAGLFFDQAIALGRSTTLSFGTGIDGLRNQDQTRYHLTGNVGLLQEIGRTWGAGIDYLRDVEYLDVFRAPALTDTLAMNLGGLVNRRLSLQFSGGAATGEVGGVTAAQVTGDRFRSYYGGAGLTVGILSNLGIGLNYTFYRYRFEDNVVLPVGLPRQTDRHGLRLSVNVAPVFSWTRR